MHAATPLPRTLADMGIEGALVVAEGDLRPCAAAFTLLDDETGTAWLRRHYRTQAHAAGRHRLAFAFETPTWRASSDWGEALGYSEANLARINREAVALCRRVALEFPHLESRVVGQVGPRNCSYVPAERMSADEAAIYHRAQVRAFKDAGADALTALGINDVDEAVGILIAARCSGVPASVCFTVDASGRLPSGLSLARAIAEVDERTCESATHFGITCPKPLQVLAALPHGLAGRVRSMRASCAGSGEAAGSLVEPPVASALAADLRAVAFVAPHIRECGGASGYRPVPVQWPRRLPAALTACLSAAPVLH